MNENIARLLYDKVARHQTEVFCRYERAQANWY
jgi:hypothetical protein